MTGYMLGDLSTLSLIKNDTLYSAARFGRFCIPRTPLMFREMHNMKLLVMFDTKDMANHQQFIQMQIEMSLREQFGEGDDDGEE